MVPLHCLFEFKWVQLQLLHTWSKVAQFNKGILEIAKKAFKSSERHFWNFAKKDFKALKYLHEIDCHLSVLLLELIVGNEAEINLLNPFYVDMRSMLSTQKKAQKVLFKTTLRPLKEDRTLNDNIFHIFVRSAKGEMTTLDISPTDTVKDVKVKVRRTSRVPSNMPRLYFQGEQLQDDRLLSDYNIKHESTLYLYFCFSWDRLMLEDEALLSQLISIKTSSKSSRTMSNGSSKFLVSIASKNEFLKVDPRTLWFS